MATIRTSTPTQHDEASTGQSGIASVADTAAEKGGELIDQARTTATSQANSQKQRAAQGLTSAADAMRQVSEQMRLHEPGLANATEMAAERTQDIARYLQQTDVNDMIRGVEDFARRQPLLFLGGAFAIGLVASRFLKASGTSQQEQLTRSHRSGYRYSDAGWRATGPGSTRTNERLARTGI